jgi:hypothetical protein
MIVWKAGYFLTAQITQEWKKDRKERPEYALLSSVFNSSSLSEMNDRQLTAFVN